MELRLDPEIPVTRVVNGHNVFNKGYHHGLRGKTYEEYYGKERAVEIRKRHSEALKGHRYWSNGNAHAFACIAITPEGKWYRFDSITQAAQKLNLNYATVRRYIKRKIKPQNGWQWFLEKDVERLIPTMIATTIFTAICLKKLPKSLSVRVRNLHILKSI